MMRLIDADNMKTVREIQMANFNSIEGVREWIDRQPTAYDVEKVVEQIRDYFCKVIDKQKEDTVPHEILEYNKAICEIVRKEGV